MKRILIFFGLLIVFAKAHGQGVKMLGEAVPNDPSDTYAIIDDKYMRGGLKTVCTWQERNAITADRRKAGMLVRVKSAIVDSTYTLGVGLTNADWVPYMSASNIADITGLQSALDAKENKSEKGNANGYASLDNGGKIPTSQLPDAILGALQFQSQWNAATNTPTIPTASTGNKGWFYITQVGGVYNGVTYNTGDWILSNGSAWERIPNSDAVTSVFGRIGAVVANSGDYNSNQITNSSGVSGVSASDALNTLNSNKANKDGSNASGTWGINISGSSSKLDNLTASDLSNPVTGYVNTIIGTNEVGIIKTFTIDGVKARIGINDGSTLNNSISGNATTATTASSSDKFAGIGYEGALVNTASYLMAFNPTTSNFGVIDQTQAKTFLGIPLGGETLQSVLDRGKSYIGNGNSIQDGYFGNFSILSEGLKGLRLGYNGANGNGMIMPIEGQGNGFDIATYNSGVISTKLTVLNNGNVGIGTTNPLSKLNVLSGLQSDDINFLKGSAFFQGSDVGLSIGQKSTAGNYGMWLQSIRPTDDVPFNLSINPKGGSVGIGTNNPANKFVVSNNDKEGFEVAVGSSPIREVVLLNYDREVNTYRPISYDASLHQFREGRLIVNKDNPNTDWSTSQLQIQGSNPAIGFHWPGVYASNLSMDVNGSLTWNGNGLFLNSSIPITQPYQVPTKKYVDDKIVSAGGVTLNTYQEITAQKQFTDTLNVRGYRGIAWTENIGETGNLRRQVVVGNPDPSVGTEIVNQLPKTSGMLLNSSHSQGSSLSGPTYSWTDLTSVSIGNANYTKVGRVVTVSFKASITSSSAPSGTTRSFVVDAPISGWTSNSMVDHVYGYTYSNTSPVYRGGAQFTEDAVTVTIYNFPPSTSGAININYSYLLPE